MSSHLNLVGAWLCPQCSSLHPEAFPAEPQERHGSCEDRRQRRQVWLRPQGCRAALIAADPPQPHFPAWAFLKQEIPSPR